MKDLPPSVKTHFIAQKLKLDTSFHYKHLGLKSHWSEHEVISYYQTTDDDFTTRKWKRRNVSTMLWIRDVRWSFDLRSLNLVNTNGHEYLNYLQLSFNKMCTHTLSPVLPVVWGLPGFGTGPTPWWSKCSRWSRGSARPPPTCRCCSQASWRRKMLFWSRLWTPGSLSSNLWCRNASLDPER